MAFPKVPGGNPAFRYMGLPNIKAKLPSRNWLIFFSITSAFAGVIYYDRREQKRIQQRWCSRVSHLAREPLSPMKLPRKVTVFLSAPPGSGTDIRPVQEHYRDFVKPIFNAAALEVEFVEARRMGELRQKVAEKARNRRRIDAGGEEDDVIGDIRKKAGVTRVDGVQGDVVLGRHAWKEYVAGLHEGWLGPLEAPVLEEDAPKIADDIQYAQRPEGTDEQVPKIGDVVAEAEQKEEKKNAEGAKPLVPPVYILPDSYPSAQLPVEIPHAFDPVGVVHFPHILGFLNTPIRFYRFVTRRHLADECGREAAAIALGHMKESPADEIKDELKVGERDWPKKYWTDEHLQGVWQEEVVLDPRIRVRMRKFILPKGLDRSGEERLMEE